MDKYLKLVKGLQVSLEKYLQRLGWALDLLDDHCGAAVQMMTMILMLMHGAAGNKSTQHDALSWWNGSARNDFDTGLVVDCNNCEKRYCYC